MGGCRAQHMHAALILLVLMFVPALSAPQAVTAVNEGPLDWLQQVIKALEGPHPVHSPKNQNQALPPLPDFGADLITPKAASCPGKVTAIWCKEDATGRLQDLAYTNSATGLQQLSCSGAPVAWSGPGTRSLFLEQDESIVAVKTCGGSNGGSGTAVTFITDNGQSLTCGQFTPGNNNQDHQDDDYDNHNFHDNDDGSDGETHLGWAQHESSAAPEPNSGPTTAGLGKQSRSSTQSVQDSTAALLNLRDAPTTALAKGASVKVHRKATIVSDTVASTTTSSSSGSGSSSYDDDDSEDGLTVNQDMATSIDPEEEAEGEEVTDTRKPNRHVRKQHKKRASGRRPRQLGFRSRSNRRHSHKHPHDINDGSASNSRRNLLAGLAQPEHSATGTRAASKLLDKLQASGTGKARVAAAGRASNSTKASIATWWLWGDGASDDGCQVFRPASSPPWSKASTQGLVQGKDIGIVGSGPDAYFMYGNKRYYKDFNTYAQQLAMRNTAASSASKGEPMFFFDVVAPLSGFSLQCDASRLAASAMTSFCWNDQYNPGLTPAGIPDMAAISLDAYNSEGSPLSCPATPQQVVQFTGNLQVLSDRMAKASGGIIGQLMWQQYTPVHCTQDQQRNATISLRVVFVPAPGRLVLQVARWLLSAAQGDMCAVRLEGQSVCEGLDIDAVPVLITDTLGRRLLQAGASMESSSTGGGGVASQQLDWQWPGMQGMYGNLGPVMP